MLIDILKTPFQNLLAIVNSTNTTTITDNQVTFGAPTSVAADADIANTTVLVSATPLNGYTGDVLVTYRRLLLTASVVSPSLNFVVTGVKTEAEIKTQIATVLNIFESDFDLTIVPPAEFGNKNDGTIVAKVESLLYAGTVIISVEWSESLDSAITTTSLTGFTPAE
jgi:hypothetical protein